MEAAIKQSFSTIDWSQPWFAPYSLLGRSIIQTILAGSSVADALNQAARHQIAPAHTFPVEFVPQAQLPKTSAYESFIFSQRQVPTRDNLHDFFNGLMWLHWPQSKRRLNQLQASAIAASGGKVSPRGPLRDALTIFDENAAVMWGQVSLQIHDFLRARNWQSALIEARAEWHSRCHIALFGHALLEKLCTPYKSITAHVVTIPAGSCHTLTYDSCAALDTQLSATLSRAFMQEKPFAPLPILGVPLWCSANAHTNFYDDLKVFRPLKP